MPRVAGAASWKGNRPEAALGAFGGKNRRTYQRRPADAEASLVVAGLCCGVCRFSAAWGR